MFDSEIISSHPHLKEIATELLSSLSWDLRSPILYRMLQISRHDRSLRLRFRLPRACGHTFLETESWSKNKQNGFNKKQKTENFKTKTERESSFFFKFIQLSQFTSVGLWRCLLFSPTCAFFPFGGGHGEQRCTAEVMQLPEPIVAWQNVVVKTGVEVALTFNDFLDVCKFCKSRLQFGNLKNQKITHLFAVTSTLLCSWKSFPVRKKTDLDCWTEPK